MKKSLLTLCICSAVLFGNTVNAQTMRHIAPMSSLSKTTLAEAEIRVLQVPDLKNLSLEDEQTMKDHSGPWRFGYPTEIALDINEFGTWEEAYGGGRIWRATFTAKDALTMNVFFDHFFLPEGATLHVYNADQSVIDGAYTHHNNQPDFLLATLPMQSESITVEYFEPADKTGEGQITIGSVIYGYRAIQPFFDSVLAEAKGLNDAGACNYDTKCSTLSGNPFGSPGEWNEQIASVGIMMSGGSGFCSGALVNNTSNNGTPYFLSANHCGTSGGGGITFMFGWESPTAICATNGNSSNGPTNKTINGATLRANRSGSDFALWQLNSAIPLSYNVYYAGWDRSGNLPTAVTGIHHPRGDVKKICLDTDGPYQSTAGGAQVWWIDAWEFGVTEPGSSGSPIFDQNKRIVGQLYGGLAACSGTSNNGSYDYYGRFNVSWNTGTSVSSRLKEWLDPLNQNPLVLDGYNPNAPAVNFDAALIAVENPEGIYCEQSAFVPVVALLNAGANNLTSVTINYNISGQATSNYVWSGNLSTGATASVILPSVSVSTSGSYVFSAVVTATNGQTDQNPSNNSASSTFDAALDGQQVSLDILLDCWGSETTWQIVPSGSATPLTTGGPYTNGAGGTTVSSEFCLAPGCYTFTIFDSFGDGLAGAEYTFCGADGNYTITGAGGAVLVSMPVANFGSQAVHTFCVEEDDPTVPCTTPYPQVTGLTSSVQANGVVLSWNPIPGSLGCQIEGGLNGSSALQQFQVIQNDLSTFFVPSGQLPLANQTYRWRVRCGCSLNPPIAGPWTPFSTFFWPFNAKSAFGETSLLMYPNPTTGSIQLSYLSAMDGKVDLRIYDLMGRLVHAENRLVREGNTDIQMDMGHLIPGMYMVEILAGAKKETGRFVLSR